MNTLNDLFNNYIIWAALFGWFTAQIIKVIINLVVHKKFLVERLFGDGGMPSGHSATVCAMTVMCGWCEGFNSAAFAIALILAIIVMHDAMGVRREAGKHAVSILYVFELLGELFTEQDKIKHDEKLKTLVGHTPLQVVLGAVVGLVVATLFIIIGGIEPLSRYADLFKNWPELFPMN
jgi:acid phosphatase family membrane protein YuiD